jgi:hypothetical protein
MATLKKFLLKIYKFSDPDLFIQLFMNFFTLSEQLLMCCASYTTPVPFNIELENNFMAKSRLHETIEKLLSY